MRPSEVCKTEGYEYSPGLDSNARGLPQVLPPSTDRVMLRGVRDRSESLWTSSRWPFRRARRLIAESGHLRFVSCAMVQVSPPSVDSVCRSVGRRRTNAISDPSGVGATVGCSPMTFLFGMICDRTHVFPLSVVFTKNDLSTLSRSSLRGTSNSPPGSVIGRLRGSQPYVSIGNKRSLVQVWPLSLDTRYISRAPSQPVCASKGCVASIRPHRIQTFFAGSTKIIAFPTGCAASRISLSGVLQFRSPFFRRAMYSASSSEDS